MKKVLFLQLKGNSNGNGVWIVNKTIASSLANLGYDVRVISIRNNPGPNVINEKLNFVIHTINEKALWEITHFSDIKKSIKSKKIFVALKKTIKKINEEYLLRKDYKELKKYIKEYNPDYIVSSHYQILKIIPNKYLNKTINHHHVSFKYLLDNPAGLRALKKFNNKVTFLWLCGASNDLAIKNGFNNSYYIYNPLKFNTKEKANVVKEKKLITVSRLNSNQKRIDLMLDIGATILPKFSDWTLELYGEDELCEEWMKIINNNPQIKLMGKTTDVKSVLLKSSIYLSTSYFEGFGLSIVEGYECALPCVGYDFGEPTSEIINDGKTGYVIDFDNKEEFINKLSALMNNEKKLKELSNNAKKYAQKFCVSQIIDEWIKLFDIIDKDCR